MDRYKGHRLPVMLYRHPFQLALGISLAVIGARHLINTHNQPSSIDALPTWLALGYAVALIVGGAGMVVGLVISGRTTWGLAIEQVGLWITAAGLLAYALGLGLATQFTARASMAVIILLALAGACLIRSRAAILDSRYSLQGIRAEVHRRNGGGS